MAVDGTESMATDKEGNIYKDKPLTLESRAVTVKRIVLWQKQHRLSVRSLFR